MSHDKGTSVVKNVQPSKAKTKAQREFIVSRESLLGKIILGKIIDFTYQTTVVIS